MYFTRKDMGSVHNKAMLQLDKKRTKTAKLTNSLIFLKTIKFKVMETIRYQLKLFQYAIIAYAFIRALENLSLLNFLRG